MATTLQHRRLAARLLVLVLMMMVHPAMAQAIEAGAISLHPRANRGPSMRFADIPLIRGTALQAYRPDWSEGYYTTSGAGQRTAHVDHQRRQITLQHSTRDRAHFEAAEVYRLVEDNHLEIALTATMHSQAPANIEWSIGLVEAFALYGGSYAGDDAPARPVVPIPPREEKDPTVIRGAKEIRLETRAGVIMVRVEAGDAGLSLLDGRMAPTRWWTLESATFWLGFTAVPLTPGEAKEIRVSIRFVPREATAPAEALSHKPSLRQMQDLFTPQPRPIVIIPQPRSLEWRQGRFAVSGQTRLLIDADAAQRAAEVLRREVQERFGWSWAIESSTRVGAEAGSIRLVTDGKLPSEAYHIEVSSEGVTLAASTGAGMFYAAQTLVQMFQMDAQGVFIPAAAIDDEPSLAFRGVHIFPGRDAMPFHRKLVERIFARFKLNHIVLQSDYTQWETDPKIWIDISVPREQIREYVDLARDNFLEPIPLVMSLGHAEWMFKNDQNLDLAEDPEAKYAYSVTNPATYDFILSVYREAIEMFQPKYFHIGHDEVTMRGRYPHREEAKKWGVTRLFLYDIQKLREFLQPHGARIMLWGDMLLAKGETYDTAAFAEKIEEARLRREGLPRDAIICDWHYQPTAPQNYTSLKIFKDAGFTTIACTWYQPMNIYTFAQAARMYDAWGLLQTTWAGYSVTEKAMQDDLKQFTAYVLAAEYAWSGESPPPDQLPYRAEDVFMRAFHPKREPTAVRAGFHVDLSSIANLSFAGEDAWLGYGRGADWSALPMDQRMEGVAFDAANAAVGLHGLLMPRDRRRPQRVVIEVDQPAEEVAFLHVSAFPAASGEVIGEYRVHFDDGTQQIIPLRYGQNIRAWNDTTATPEATIAWSGRTSSGLQTAARLLLWTNPDPRKTIRSIEFTTQHPYASPILLGLAGLQ